jgi:hypothetical protein
LSLLEDVMSRAMRMEFLRSTGVFAVNPDGSLLWFFPARLGTVGPDNNYRGFRDLVVADIDRDRMDEVIAVSEDELAYASKSRVNVDIDFKPRDLRNNINPKGKGVIPVAILTTDTLDAITLDPLSVEFGPDAKEVHGRGHIKDTNGDGKPDLLLHFKTQDTGIQCGDTSASRIG